MQCFRCESSHRRAAFLGGRWLTKLRRSKFPPRSRSLVERPPSPRLFCWAILKENMLFGGFVAILFGLPSITDVSRLDSVCGILDVPTFWDCVHRLRQSIHPSVVDVFDVHPLAKPVWLHGEKFEEHTIISKGLDMADAVLQAISLPPVVRTQSIGKLMQAVIAVVANKRGQICQYRYEQQAIIEQVQMQLSPLNSRLLELVPLHGRGINSGMNFALLYCIQIACKYSDVYVVDSMLQGFPAMYRVPAGGVFRPVVEPAVERYSAAENNECFDRVVRRLQQTARRASRASSEWSDLVAIWKGVVGEGGEIARGLMDGGPDGRGYSRGQIWSKFAHVPNGPRCLLRFAVWQNGKLRGCDDALFCGHNERTQMEETIVCITSEFPTLVAAEFRKHCEDACRLGTDDVVLWTLRTAEFCVRSHGLRSSLCGTPTRLRVVCGTSLWLAIPLDCVQQWSVLTG